MPAPHGNDSAVGPAAVWLCSRAVVLVSRFRSLLVGKNRDSSVLGLVPMYAAERQVNSVPPLGGEEPLTRTRPS